MKSKGKSSLFLMELMISLLIFAVCACVCAAIIATAAVDINNSRDMSNALILSQNKAELIKSGNNNFTVDIEYYSADLLPIDKADNAVYSSVSRIISGENGVNEYSVEIYRVSDNKLIYDINSAFYL